MSLPKSEGEGTIEEIKEAMVQKHLPLVEEAGKKRCADTLLPGNFQHTVLLPGAGQSLV